MPDVLEPYRTNADLLADVRVVLDNGGRLDIALRDADSLLASIDRAAALP